MITQKFINTFVCLKTVLNENANPKRARKLIKLNYFVFFNNSDIGSFLSCLAANKTKLPKDFVKYTIAVIFCSHVC